MDVDMNPPVDEDDTLLHRVLASPIGADGEIARVILAHPHVDVNVRNEEWHQQCEHSRGGDTPLQKAVRTRNVEAVKMLLSREELDVNVRNACNTVPLALAAGDREIFGLLFGHKDVDINSPVTFGRRRCGMILEKAVYWKPAASPEIVRVLATHECLDVRSWNYAHNPVLVWAACTKNPQLMKLLLARDDIDVNVTGNWGHTPLLRCIYEYYDHKMLRRYHSNFREVLKLLLSQKDINLDVRDEKGRTPARLARKRGIFKLYREVLAETEVRRQSNSGSSAKTISPKRCVLM